MSIDDILFCIICFRNYNFLCRSTRFRDYDISPLDGDFAVNFLASENCPGQAYKAHLMEFFQKKCLPHKKQTNN